MPRLSWNEIENRAEELTDAHHALDRAVDRLYQRKLFASDADRVALLFRRYQELTSVHG